MLIWVCVIGILGFIAFTIVHLTFAVVCGLLQWLESRKEK